MGGWELGIPLIGGSNGGSRLWGDWDIRHEEVEYRRAVYCDGKDSGLLWSVRLEAGGMVVSAVVETRRFRFGGGEEEGSGGIGHRGGDKQVGGNALGNDDRMGMRAGVQSSNLIY